MVLILASLKQYRQQGVRANRRNDTLPSRRPKQAALTQNGAEGRMKAGYSLSASKNGYGWQTGAVLLLCSRHLM
jgi:hypothetical protein